MRKMGLSKRELGRDEELLVAVRSHRGSLLLPLGVLVICAGGAVAILVEATALPSLGRKVAAGLVLAIGIALFLARWLKWRGRSINLTTERIVVKSGAGRTYSEQVRLIRIVEVHLLRTMSDRLVRRGSLVLDLDDGDVVVVDRLAKPEAFQRLVIRQIDRVRELAYGTVYESFDDDGGFEESNEPPRPHLVTEFDATPPRGTPAVASSRHAVMLARLDEVDRLESEGLLSPREASERRRELRDAI
jgi:Bacterial PH domain